MQHHNQLTQWLDLVETGRCYEYKKAILRNGFVKNVVDRQQTCIMHLSLPQRRRVWEFAAKQPENRHWSCRFCWAAHWNWIRSPCPRPRNQSPTRADSARTCRAHSDAWKSTRRVDHCRTFAAYLGHGARQSRRSICDQPVWIKRHFLVE